MERRGAVRKALSDAAYGEATKNLLDAGTMFDLGNIAEGDQLVAQAEAMANQGETLSPNYLITHPTRQVRKGGGKIFCGKRYD
jgi:hypothetical protein